MQYQTRLRMVQAMQWNQPGDCHGVFKARVNSNKEFSGQWIVNTFDGPVVIHPTDWIINHENGLKQVMKDKQFRAMYEPTPTYIPVANCKEMDEQRV